MDMVEQVTTYRPLDPEEGKKEKKTSVNDTIERYARVWLWRGWSFPSFVSHGRTSLSIVGGLQLLLGCIGSSVRLVGGLNLIQT
jgi:hypothetical protein